MATRVQGRTKKVQRRAKKIARSDFMEAAARWGLAASGASFVLVGALSLRLALGFRGRPTDRQGALATLASTPFGKALLLPIALGFAGYAAWRLAVALNGRRVSNGERQKPRQRAASACLGIFYAGLAASSARLLFTGPAGGSDDKAKKTAMLLGLPGGRFIVFGIGAGVCVAGFVNGFRAVTGAFRKKLKTWEMSKKERRTVTGVAVAGYLSRFALFEITGAFLIRAAITYDPHKGMGIDGALREIAAQPFGRVLLGVAALGLVCYGLYRIAEARFRKV